MDDALVGSLVKAVQEYALKHYNDGGWDVIVECWSADEIASEVTESLCKTPEDAIKVFAPMVDVWADRQADAINSAF